MAVYTKVEFKNLCRLCISFSQCSLDIFSGTDPSDLRDKIFNCLSIQVDESDPLPTKICKVCLDKLEGYNEFRLTCASSESTLQCYYSLFKSTIDHDGTIFVKSNEAVSSEPEAFIGKVEDVAVSSRLLLQDYRGGSNDISTGCTVDQDSDDLQLSLTQASDGFVSHQDETGLQLNQADNGTLGLNLHNLSDMGEGFPLVGDSNIVVLDINKCNLLDIIDPTAPIYVVNVDPECKQPVQVDSHEVMGYNEESQLNCSMVNVENDEDMGKPSLGDEGMDNISQFLRSMCPKKNMENVERDVIDLQPINDGITYSARESVGDADDVAEDFADLQPLVSAPQLTDDLFGNVTETSLVDVRENSMDGILVKPALDVTDISNRRPSISSSTDDLAVGLSSEQVFGASLSISNIDSCVVKDSAGKAGQELTTVDKNTINLSSLVSLDDNPPQLLFNESLTHETNTKLATEPHSDLSSTKTPSKITVDRPSSPVHKLDYSECLKKCMKNRKKPVYKKPRKPVQRNPLPNTEGNECLLCHKTFESRKAIGKHMKTHQDVKLYQCPYCNKCYGRNWHRNRHIENAHNPSSPIKDKNKFTCHICSKEYSRKEAMRNHVLLHNRVYACDKCDAILDTDASFKKHKTTNCMVHQICDKCGAQFDSKTLYLQHFSSNCGKDIYISDNVDLEFPCTLCNTVLPSCSLWKSHMDRHKRISSSGISYVKGEVNLMSKGRNRNGSSSTRKKSPRIELAELLPSEDEDNPPDNISLAKSTLTESQPNISSSCTVKKSHCKSVNPQLLGTNKLSSYQTVQKYNSNSVDKSLNQDTPVAADCSKKTQSSVDIKSLIKDLLKRPRAQRKNIHALMDGIVAKRAGKSTPSAPSDRVQRQDTIGKDKPVKYNISTEGSKRTHGNTTVNASRAESDLMKNNACKAGSLNSKEPLEKPGDSLTSATGQQIEEYIQKMAQSMSSESVMFTNSPQPLRVKNSFTKVPAYSENIGQRSNDDKFISTETDENSRKVKNNLRYEFSSPVDSIEEQTTDLVMKINDNLPDTLLSIRMNADRADTGSTPEKLLSKAESGPSNFSDDSAHSFENTVSSFLNSAEPSFENDLEILLEEVAQTIGGCHTQTFSAPCSSDISQCPDGTDCDNSVTSVAFEPTAEISPNSKSNFKLYERALPKQLAHSQESIKDFIIFKNCNENLTELTSVVPSNSQFETAAERFTDREASTVESVAPLAIEQPSKTSGFDILPGEISSDRRLEVQQSLKEGDPPADLPSSVPQFLLDSDNVRYEDISSLKKPEVSVKMLEVDNHPFSKSNSLNIQEPGLEFSQNRVISVSKETGQCSKFLETDKAPFEVYPDLKKFKQFTKTSVNDSLLSSDMVQESLHQDDREYNPSFEEWTDSSKLDFRSKDVKSLQVAGALKATNPSGKHSSSDNIHILRQATSENSELNLNTCLSNQTSTVHGKPTLLQTLVKSTEDLPNKNESSIEVTSAPMQNKNEENVPADEEPVHLDVTTDCSDHTSQEEHSSDNIEPVLVKLPFMPERIVSDQPKNNVDSKGCFVKTSEHVGRTSNNLSEFSFQPSENSIKNVEKMSTLIFKETLSKEIMSLLKTIQDKIVEDDERSVQENASDGSRSVLRNSNSGNCDQDRKDLPKCNPVTTKKSLIEGLVTALKEIESDMMVDKSLCVDCPEDNSSGRLETSDAVQGETVNTSCVSQCSDNNVVDISNREGSKDESIVYRYDSDGKKPLDESSVGSISPVTRTALNKRQRRTNLKNSDCRSQLVRHLKGRVNTCKNINAKNKEKSQSSENISICDNKFISACRVKGSRDSGSGAVRRNLSKRNRRRDCFKCVVSTSQIDPSKTQWSADKEDSYCNNIQVNKSDVCLKNSKKRRVLKDSVASGRTGIRNKRIKVIEATNKVPQIFKRKETQVKTKDVEITSEDQKNVSFQESVSMASRSKEIITDMEHLKTQRLNCATGFEIRECSIKIKLCDTLLETESESKVYEMSGTKDSQIVASPVSSERLNSRASHESVNSTGSSRIVSLDDSLGAVHKQPLRTMRILLERFDPQKIAEYSGKKPSKPSIAPGSFNQPYNLRRSKDVQSYICSLDNS